MNKLYVVRHGETDWNIKGILQGKTDIELNENGVRQAKLLKNKINIDDIDVVICSPLKRTKQTAEILVANKKNIIYDELILERDFGDFEGKPIEFDLISKQWDYKLNDKSNNIESIKDCLKRAEKFINKLNKEYSNKKILIISHGAFIKTLHFCIKGYNENTDLLSFNPKNAEVYEYII